MEMPDLEQHLFYISELSQYRKIYQKIVSESKGFDKAKVKLSDCHHRILVGKHACSMKMRIAVV